MESARVADEHPLLLRFLGRTPDGHIRFTPAHGPDTVIVLSKDHR